MRKKKDKEKELLAKPALEEAVAASESGESEASEEASSAEERMEEDIALFHELFPDVKGDAIPEAVWARVDAGERLAASYALYVIRTMREEEKIQKVNEENEKKAPPRIRHDGGDDTYFSPEAVKAMSRSEVKKNYDAILRSMEKWN